MGKLLPIESVNIMNQSQNQNHTAKPNVLSNLDKRVADAATAKQAGQMQAEMPAPAGAEKPPGQQAEPMAGPAAPAQQGDNSIAKQ